MQVDLYMQIDLYMQVDICINLYMYAGRYLYNLWTDFEALLGWQIANIIMD